MIIAALSSASYYAPVFAESSAYDKAYMPAEGHGANMLIDLYHLFYQRYFTRPYVDASTR